jgi:hypothetical protein
LAQLADVTPHLKGDRGAMLSFRPGQAARWDRWLVAAAVLVLALPGCDAAPSASPTGGAASAGTAEGSPSPLPSTSEPQGSPLPAPSGKPTSADLILADVAAGRLDEATALLYRIYAVFGDARLPPAYASDMQVEDGAALAAARMQIDSLPAAIAAELRPFLARPTDPSSVFYDVRRPTSAGEPAIRLASARSTSGRATGLLAPAPVVCNPVSGWGYALGQSNFKVWGECGTPEDDADIQQVSAMVENFWDAESTFMSREPPADLGTSNPDEWLNDAGGDGRIDVYLVNGCLTRGGTCHSFGPDTLGTTWDTPPHVAVKGVGVTSSYVLLPKVLLARTALFRAVVAHELFHVFQNAMNFDGVSYTWGNHWIVESTAKWAEWHFSQIDDNVTPWFDGFQGTDLSLASTANGNAYQSFTWPLYLEEEASDPSVIATLWQGLEGQASATAVDAAIDRIRPFKAHFREFALRNWNKELGVGAPMEPLHPEPPTDGSQPEGPHDWAETVLTGHDRGQPWTFHEAIPSLYAKYAPFNVDHDVGQVILDLGGLGPSADFDGDALVKVKDHGWERRKLKKGQTTWCIDNPDDAIEQFVVVLSNHQIQNSPVNGSWTVEALKEPCLSYQVNIRWTDVYGGIADTFTFSGWIDHLEPDLSNSGAVTLSGTGTIEGSRPGWAACNPGIGTVPSGKGAAILMVSIVDDDPTSRTGDSASFSAFPDLSAADFGVSTQPFTMTRKGGSLSVQSDGSIGDLCPQTWHGTITATMKVKEPLGDAEGN